VTTALIIGAGIAGPVTAMALQKAGIHARLFEGRSPDASELGSWLTLQANGIDALRAVDAHRLVADIGFPTTSMRFTSGTGKVLGTVVNGAPTPDGVTSQMVARAELYQALRNEAVRRGADISYDQHLVAATTTPAGVTATFADGSTATGDLLIGADGIRSTVRTIIDPSAPAARYVPVLNVGGFVPGLDTGTPADQFQMTFGSRCFFGYTSTPDGGTVWFANPPHKTEPARGELAAITDADWRTMLLDLLGEDTGPARDIITAAPAPLIGWATYDIPTVPRWHRDNLAIIGDAAHATAPSAGQGAALALEDAVLIAKCLRDTPDAPTAFAIFDQLRRRRVEKVVAYGHRSSNAKAAGPIGRRIRDTILPIIFKRLDKTAAHPPAGSPITTSTGTAGPRPTRCNRA